MVRYTAKEAVATACGMDIAEMNDYRYQPHDWTMPIWDFGKHPYTARKIGSKKTPVNRYDHISGGSNYDWKPVYKWQTWEVLEGSDKED